MARINLTSSKGWFRIWLVLSIGWWLFLLTMLIVALHAHHYDLPNHIWIEIVGASVAPPIVYATGWILVKAARWIRAGFKGGE